MQIVEDVSNGMAELTGQYQNFSFLGKYLPWLWIFLTWCARVSVGARLIVLTQHTGST